MLAARAEAEPGEERLLALNLESQAMWPAFVRALEAASGHDLGYRDEGTLIVAVERDDAEALRHTYEFQRDLGLDVAWIPVARARRLEPHLATGVTAAVLSAADHQVDNRALVGALAAALRGAGGRLHENAGEVGVHMAAGRAAGVHLEGRTVPADVVVLAAGAWCRGVPGVPPAALPPVRPVKGQMLAVRMDPAAPQLSHVLWGPGIYCVPRRDGRLLLGATVEERGFDRSLTPGGLFTLLEAALDVLPGIDELPVEETWVGHRPTSRDDAPIFGQTPVDGLVVATGHHRNGILLAPMTAHAVSELILTGTLPAVARGFGLDRFASRSAAVAGAAS
jgi:glycine oxidase